MKDLMERGFSKRSGKVAFEVASCLVAFSFMLSAPGAFGADAASPGQSLQAPPAAYNDTPSAQPQSADVEQQLARAREQLTQAARQVAELSAQLANRAWVRRSLQRSVVGVQLDPASGQTGARVLEVSPGGPAAEGGVRAGDLIVAVNGTTIAGADTAAQVVDRLRDVPANTPVRLRLQREDKTLSIELTTQPASAFFFVRPVGNVPVPPVPPVPKIPTIPRTPASVVVAPPLPSLPYLQALSADTAGMELATLTPALGKYFGTDEGVLVIRAPHKEAFQLQDGDVIIAIDGRKPLNGVHATRILASYEPGERLTLRILRQKRPMSLTITLPGDVSESVP